MFLVQLAVMALRRAGQASVPEDAAIWRAALRGLTADFPDDAPWHLIVDAPAQPGFLQPPDPGGLKWEKTFVTPDAMDMVITSRNHELKIRIAQENTPQDWIYALVSLQTMEGRGGSGLNGIARMNGGFSSRVMLGLAPAKRGEIVIDLSCWWRRDVQLLLGTSEGKLGCDLLWCVPWAEGRMLSMDQLSPFFIEVCRRIRLVETENIILAKKEGSSERRVDAKDRKGMAGDPWAPIHIADSKALTLSDRDWSYGLIHQLLYQEPREWEKSLLAKSGPDEAGDMLLIAEAFARTDKIEGFKSRIIPVPEVVVKTMFTVKAASLAKEQVELIGKVDAALRFALVLMSSEGDHEKLKETLKKLRKADHNKADRNKDPTTPARDALQRQADALFFPAL